MLDTERTVTEEGDLRGLRVLVVEDETLVAMLLEDMLGELGARVAATASRVARALEIVNSGETAFDAAVLDVSLAGENAFPIATALIEKGIPFAFSTGYGNAGLPEEWRSRPTLQKPFTQEQVGAVLRRAMGARLRPPG